MTDEPVGTFGKRLDVLMREYGLYQAELARRAETMNEAIRKWRKGIVEPTYLSLKRLHAAIGCSWEELMGE